MMSSGPRSTLLLQRSTLESGGVRRLTESPGHDLSPQDVGLPRAQAVCRAPPSAGRETEKQDPTAKPQDQDHCQETEAKGGGPNLWVGEFSTFSPSSSASSHLCPEGQEGPRSRSKTVPGDA